MRSTFNYESLLFLLFMIDSFQRGCTGSYLELNDFNNDNRDLVESCPFFPCEARNNTCTEMEFDSCSDILCVDACDRSYFNNSEVFCEYESACARAMFENSQVICNESQACVGAKFINSAVECQPSVDENKNFSCNGAVWFQCNCCLNYWESGSCPPDIPPCFDDGSEEEGPVDTFCASTFLGQTCKDWGNPICSNSSVESLLPIHPAHECSAVEDIVECGLLQNCEEMGGFSSCSVNCIGDQGCNYTIFNQSTVACLTRFSCSDSTFDNSDVTCIAQDSCLFAQFVSQSNVTCQGPLSCDSSFFLESNAICTEAESCVYTAHFKGSAYCSVSSACNFAFFYDSAIDCLVDGACDEAIWMPCSCCVNSEACPMDVEPCYDDNGSPDRFCNITLLGQTCKDWGNPICAVSAVSSLPPLHPAETCSANVEVLECTGDCSMNLGSFVIDSCSVFCLYDCYGLSFENSTVLCYDSGSCDSAFFQDSEVECSNGACMNANFKSTAVNCSSFSSCSGATMDECSCCLNSDNCPDGGEFCFDETGSSDLFCSKIYNDQKCLNMVDRLCKDFVPTLAPTPAQQSLTTPVDMPINIEAPSPTNITNVTIAKNPKNGQLSIQPNNTVTYTPNKGFAGVDEFIIAFCYKDSHCETMNVEVKVTATMQTDPADDGTSKGLYALLSLIVIPLIITSMFAWRRYGQKCRDSEPLEPSNPSPDLPPTNPSNESVSSPDPSAMCQTSMVECNEISISMSDDAARQSFMGGVRRSTGQVSRRLSPPGIESYTLSNKDQCRTHIGEVKEVPVADAVPME